MEVDDAVSITQVIKSASSTEDQISSSTTTSPSSVTAAELRRQARRRKILENQGERFKKILGPSATEDEIAKLVKSVPDEPHIPPGIKSVVDLILPSSAPSGIIDDDDWATSNSSTTTGRPTTAQGQEQLIGPFGNVSPTTQRYLIATFGFTLPIIIPATFSYFLLYFILWELTSWFLVQRFTATDATNQLPLIVAVLLPLVGVPQGMRDQLKTLYRLCMWLWIDFCCFATSIFASQLILSTVLAALL